MALLTPVFTQPAGGDTAPSYSALDHRLQLISPLWAQEGVVSPHFGLLKVSQRAAGANFSVDISSGWAVIIGDDVSLQGTYVCFSSAVENRTIAAPPGSGTRVHRVVARVNDRLHNGALAAGTYTFTIEVLTDTGSGTPAVPNSAISLATVSVSAGQGSVTDAHITDTRPWAFGPLPENGSLPMLGGWASAGAGFTPSYRKTADGWVFLSGRVLRTAASFSAISGTSYDVTTALPAQLRPAAGRNCAALNRESGICDVNYSTANQRLNFALFETKTIVQNVSWVSLDGVSWKV